MIELVFKKVEDLGELFQVRSSMTSSMARLTIILVLTVAGCFGVPCEPNISPRRSVFQEVCQALPAYDAAFNDINMTQKVCK